jgi:indolepyruvate ferredoxin oxidoreductase
LARVVARHYADLLAYKDEYEVARMLTSVKLKEEIKRTFGDTARYSFNLAPPLLNVGRVNGRPKKHEFPMWIAPLLRILAGLRALRGTLFDPFRWSVDRRLDRYLITEYECLVGMVLPLVSEQNLGAAAQLLALVGQVRGYGPVKNEAAVAYRQSLQRLMAAFVEYPTGLADTDRLRAHSNRVSAIQSR